MSKLRLCALCLTLALAAGPARADAEADEWRMFGHALALLHHVVRVAAQSPDPEAMRKGVDAMLAGQIPEANRAAGEMLDEMLRDMPAEHRDTIVSVARDILTIARREGARAAAQPAAPASVERALQARKDLHAMGLRYWDEQQFLDAVRRGDRIAVALYLAAQGLESGNRLRNPPAGR